MALRRGPPPHALVFPRCCSVHTFGMRFALDLVWLDADGAVIRIDKRVRPCRVKTNRHAAAVIEVAACDGRAAAQVWQARSPAQRRSALE